MTSLAAQRWTLALGSVSVIASVGLLVLGIGKAKPILGLSLVGVAAAIGGVSGALGIAASFYRQRARRLRREVEQNVVESAGRAPGAAPVLAAESPAAGHSQLEAYADVVFESVRTVSSTEVKEVEEFIERYPPRFPRGAKRMLNHARLLTKIAREREMFGGTPELTSAHLGKWIVLRERFPRLAEQIAGRHAALGDGDELRELGIVRMAEQEGSKELMRLIEGEPPLAALVQRLVYFQPAEAEERGDREEPAELAEV